MNIPAECPLDVPEAIEIKLTASSTQTDFGGICKSDPK